MKKTTLIILFFLLINHFDSFAQSVFKSGYVLLNNNDTLKGFLKDDAEINLLSSVTFSSNENGQPAQKYSLNDVKQFSFMEGGLFQRIQFNNVENIQTSYFAKVLVTGYYNLLSFRRKDIQYFVLNHDDSTFLLYNDIISNSGIYDTKGNYRNLLSFVSRNCGQLNRDASGVSYKDTYLINFITKLNECIAPAITTKSLYIKPKSKTSIYIYAAGLPLGKNYEYTGRIGSRSTIPSISRNTSLNISITYLSKKATGNFLNAAYNGFKAIQKSDILSAGLTILENFTAGKIQPYAEVGFGFSSLRQDHPITRTSSVNVKENGINFIGAIGIEGYITKKLAIKADWRYENLLHYPVVGIAYFF